jgi:hypothetical protein
MPTSEFTDYTMSVHLVLYCIVFYLHSVDPYKDIEQVKISLILDTHKDIKHVKIAIHIGTYTNIKSFLSISGR